MHDLKKLMTDAGIDGPTILIFIDVEIILMVIKKAAKKAACNIF